MNAVEGGLLAVVVVIARINLRYITREKKVMSFEHHSLVPGNKKAALWAGGDNPVTVLGVQTEAGWWRAAEKGRIARHSSFS